MKMKLRLYFALAITFIVYVSFKILEPDIQAQKASEVVHVKQDFADIKPVRFRPLKSPEQLNVTSIRESQLLQTYDVDWNINLEGNPWDIAGRWVSFRHVLPDSSQELGKNLLNQPVPFLST